LGWEQQQFLPLIVQFILQLWTHLLVIQLFEPQQLK